MLDGVRDPIDRLYRLSSWIRNPLTRSISKKALQHTQIDPDTGVDWLEAVKLFDYDYIRTKIWQLVKPTSSTGQIRLKSSAEEEALSISQTWLVDRLAKCNGERRRLFSYWRQHRFKLQRDADVFFKDTSRAIKDTPSRAEHTNELLPIAVSLATSATQFQRGTRSFQVARSTTTVSEYAPSLTPAILEGVSFPPPPEEDGAELKEFDCPYCYTVCSKAILAEHAWQ